MGAQDRGRAQALVAERGIETLQVLWLQPVQPVVPDARAQVQPHGAAVAL